MGWRSRADHRSGLPPNPEEEASVRLCAEDSRARYGPPMLTLVLTRHGATPRSHPEQHLGQRIDVGLSEKGRADMGALASRLAQVRWDRVISSPLRRAKESAGLLAPAAEVELDARIAEMDYGAWEGLTYAEIDARYREERARWVEDPATRRCPAGESGDQVAERARGFLSDLLVWAGGRTDPLVLAVAHSTLNRVLLCVALEVPLRRYRDRFRQDPGNMTVLRFRSDQSGGLLVLANDLTHVRGAPPLPD